jgi:hypothetical protein
VQLGCSNLSSSHAGAHFVSNTVAYTVSDTIADAVADTTANAIAYTTTHAIAVASTADTVADFIDGADNYEHDTVNSNVMECLFAARQLHCMSRCRSATAVSLVHLNNWRRKLHRRYECGAVFWQFELVLRRIPCFDDGRCYGEQYWFVALVSRVCMYSLHPVIVVDRLR